MKGVMILLLITFFLSVLLFGENIHVYFPRKLKPVNTFKSDKWYWCKSGNARFIWTFDPIPTIGNEFYIFFKVLQTDEEGNTGLASEKIKLRLVVSQRKEKCMIIRPCLVWDSREHICIEWGEPYTVCRVSKILKRTIAVSYLKLKNFFKPVEKVEKTEFNLSKVGYTALGSAKFNIPKVLVELLRTYPFEVILEWPPISDNYYIAVSEKIPPKIVFLK